MKITDLPPGARFFYDGEEYISVSNSLQPGIPSLVAVQIPSWKLVWFGQETYVLLPLMECPHVVGLPEQPKRPSQTPKDG